MRITIIPSENKISIDGEPMKGCDVSWIPEFVGDITGVLQKVHAVQWYDDHGEIELVTKDNNIPITELGIFEQAVTKYQEKKLEIEQEMALEAERLAQEQAELLLAETQYLEELGELDIEKLISEL